MAMEQPVGKQREFHFTDKDFEQIRTLVARQTGIALSDAKRELVYGRLSRRLRALNISSFSDYIGMLDEDNGSGEELINFINAITTNLTSFFRENHHFQYIKSTLMPELMKQKAYDRRIRIWSAGCSTGEEPYSIAMTMRECLPMDSTWDIKILATDLDSNVVAKASSGVYEQERVNGISPERLRRFFKQGKGAHEGMVRVRDELQEMITFKQLNLMHEWPMKGPFDFMFCRNVVIYFDKPTKQVLFDRYANILVEKGHLFIGHSETLFKLSDRFDSLGNTIYRKKK